MMTSKMKSTKIAPVDVKPPPYAPISDSSLVSCLVPKYAGIMTSYVERRLRVWFEAYIVLIWAT